MLTSEQSSVQVQWFRDGKPVSADARHKIEAHDDTGTHKLTITGRKSLTKTTFTTLSFTGVQSADIGEYRAEAVNTAGKAWTEAPVTLEGLSHE